MRPVGRFLTAFSRACDLIDRQQAASGMPTVCPRQAGFGLALLTLALPSVVITYAM